mmetsp:Transcript_8867/g.26571  ORF Transcript_8867/g.26571 Transcript_8867/m.26571 type:complete len:172 (-) Transcript_8867:162-677(-)
MQSVPRARWTWPNIANLSWGFTELRGSKACRASIFSSPSSGDASVSLTAEQKEGSCGRAQTDDDGSLPSLTLHDLELTTRTSRGSRLHNERDAFSRTSLGGAPRGDDLFPCTGSLRFSQQAVPVVFVNNWEPPFSWVVDWKDEMVSVPEADTDKTVDILHYISHQRQCQMQ